MPVTVSCRTAKAADWEAYLMTRALAVLRALGVSRYELSLALVDDVEMRALNSRFRGRDRATDVLSFPMNERAFKDALPPACRGAQRLLGDVAISLDTAARQARASRCALARRLDVLLVHGVLHLLGYDHELSPAEDLRMRRRAREVEAGLPARTVARRHRR